MAEYEDMELDWDDEISDGEFNVLPRGTYDFEVLEFSRDRFGGSAKVMPCNRIIVKIRLESEEGLTNTINTNMFLTKKWQWKIAQFFVSIGMKAEGENVKMNWAEAVGERGRATIKIIEYNGNEYNEVVKFLPPKKKTTASPKWEIGDF